MQKRKQSERVEALKEVVCKEVVLLVVGEIDGEQGTERAKPFPPKPQSRVEAEVSLCCLFP
jgi:hypothetical protein